MASAVAAITGAASARISAPVIWSTSHFETTSQPAIGLSKTSRKGNLADEGIGARTEAQLVGMRRQADVDRQHPELAHHLQHAVLGGDRQRHDEQIDACDAAEIHQFGDVAELRIAGHDRRRAAVLAIVEDAADADVVVRLGFDGVDQVFGRFAAADDDGTALEPADADPAAHQAREGQTETGEDEEAGNVPRGHPDARIGVADLAEEGDHGEQDEDHRPGEEDAAELQGAAAERNDRIAVGELDHDHGGERTADERRRIPPGQALVRGDIGEVDRHANGEDRGEFDETGNAGKQDRRDRARRQAGGDQTRRCAQRRIAGNIGAGTGGRPRPFRFDCAGGRSGRRVMLNHIASVHTSPSCPQQQCLGDCG